MKRSVCSLGRCVSIGRPQPTTISSDKCGEEPRCDRLCSLRPARLGENVNRPPDEPRAPLHTSPPTRRPCEDIGTKAAGQRAGRPLGAVPIAARGRRPHSVATRPPPPFPRLQLPHQPLPSEVFSPLPFRLSSSLAQSARRPPDLSASRVSPSGRCPQPRPAPPRQTRRPLEFPSYRLPKQATSPGNPLSTRCQRILWLPEGRAAYET